MILIDPESGAFVGGSDPRKGGCALGFNLELTSVPASYPDRSERTRIPKIVFRIDLVCLLSVFRLILSWQSPPKIKYHHGQEFTQGDFVMGYFKDFREHIAALDKAGLLVKIDEQINKDTELMPLVRWQFRGLSEEERRAFMFTNVIDAKGRKYDIPVVVGTSGGVAADLRLRPAMRAGRNRRPLEPSAEQSDRAEDCRECAGARRGLYGRVAAGKRRPGGIPDSYLHAGLRLRAVHDGVALVHQRSRDRHDQCRQLPRPYQKPDAHRRVFELEQPRRLPLAQMPGAGHSAPSRAGHRRAALRRLYRAGAHTVQRERVGCRRRLGRRADRSRASAIPTICWCRPMPRSSSRARSRPNFSNRKRPSANPPATSPRNLLNPYFEVKCITHRKNPIFATIISQMPPSESSVMRQVAAEGNYLRFLRDQCNIPGIVEVVFHTIAVRQICVINMKKINQAHVWQALHSMVGYNPATGKMVIAVDEDINPRNLDSLFWALAFRMQPHRDVLIIRNRTPRWTLRRPRRDRTGNVAWTRWPAARRC